MKSMKRASPRTSTIRRARRRPVSPADDRARSPLQEYDLLSCTIRFFMAAIFGIFIDIVIACLAGVVMLMGYRPGFGWLLPVLVAVPLVWGALGIFSFNDMLDLAGEIVERFFLFWR